MEYFYYQLFKKNLFFSFIIKLIIEIYFYNISKTFMHLINLSLYFLIILIINYIIFIFSLIF